MNRAISQIFEVRYLEDQDEIVDRAAEGQRLWNLDEAGVVVPSSEPLVGEPEHGTDVMAQEHTLLVSCPFEDLRIQSPVEPHVADTDDIDLRSSASKATDDSRIEVLVGGKGKYRRRSAALLAMSQELFPESLVLGPVGWPDLELGRDSE